MPMNQITDTIAAHRLAQGKQARMERNGINDYLVDTIWNRADGRIGCDKDYSETNKMLSVSDSSFKYPAEQKDLKL